MEKKTETETKYYIQFFDTGRWRDYFPRSTEEEALEFYCEHQDDRRPHRILKVTKTYEIIRERQGI